MASGQAKLHRHVQQLFGSGCVGSLTDAELLGRFVARRDEYAFEALVTRHGPMVLRVCQRVLHDGHAAEDAFQATFLVLAHKAHRLQAGATLNGWLHGVALRVATKTRSQTAKRLRRECKVPTDHSWEPGVDPERADVAALLHEEVDRLPESYRIPIILCYLQGLSYEVVARRLGVSEGAVRGRLARARDRLRVRLTRRGVIVPAGLLGVGEAWTSATATAATAVPAGLVELAVGAAMSMIGGKGEVVGAVSASVVVLTKGVLRTMFMTQLRIGATALVLAIGGLASATMLLADRNVNASAPGPSALPAEEDRNSRPEVAPIATKNAHISESKLHNAVGDKKGIDEPALGIEIKPRPWETVVRIKVQGNGSVGFGSGTVIQSTKGESLILTHSHIFKNSHDHRPSPQKYPYRVTVDLFDGVLDTTRAQVRYLETLPAEVVDFDLETDLGLLRIRPGRILPAASVVPPSWKPQAKMSMVTAGCSEGRDATFWSTRITKPNNHLFSDTSYRAIECNFAPKQGRSGGGLFTLEGDLAGVCNYAEPKGDRGFYAAPKLIHQLLARNQLAFLYTGRGAPETAPQSSLTIVNEAKLAPLIRNAEDQLEKGDLSGVRATTERLNEQLRNRREELESQLRHLDTLSRRSDELREAAERHNPPAPDRSRWRKSGSIPPGLEGTPNPADQEQRLRDIEQKLDRLLEEKKEAGKSPS